MAAENDNDYGETGEGEEREEVEEEKEREVPSAPKTKEIGIGKGIVLLPPERLKEKEEKEEEEREKGAIEYAAERTKRIEEFKRTEPSSNLFVLLALFFAIVAFIFAIYSTFMLTQMRNELKEIGKDLRSFKEADIVINTKFGNFTHKVEASLPIREILTPFTIPITPQEIEGTGTITVILPGYNFPINIPWNGTIAISGSVNFDTSKLSEDRKMMLSYELPGKGELNLVIKGEDLWTPQLENITERIEKISR